MRLITEHVPEGTGRFRLPFPRAQASGRNGPSPGETVIPDILPGPVPGCFKIRFMQESSELQASKWTEIY
jgi:hypothetical protein